MNVNLTLHIEIDMCGDNISNWDQLTDSVSGGNYEKKQVLYR